MSGTTYLRFDADGSSSTVCPISTETGQRPFVSQSLDYFHSGWPSFNTLVPDGMFTEFMRQGIVPMRTSNWHHRTSSSGGIR